MRHVARALATLAGLVTLAALAPAARSEATFSADLSAIGAARLNGDAVPDRGLQWHGKYAYAGAGFEWRAEARARWNQAYADADRYGEAARDAYRSSADWRELYLSTQGGDWRLSAGWQQVVWGRADNLRILDQVNPLDYREFVLPDLNDSRRAVFMLRGVREVAGWEVEALYLPWFVSNRNAAPGSEYFIPTVEPLLAQGFELSPEHFPARKLSNGELGVHAAHSFGATDVSLIAFHTRDDDPVFRVLPPTAAGGAPRLQPEYHRQWQFGTGVAHAFGSGFVLRGEMSWLPRVTYNALAHSDGLQRSPTLRALLALDYPWRDWLFAVQAADRRIADWRPDYLVRERQPVYSVSATGNTFSARLETRLALTAMPDGDGRWWQIKNVYKPDDTWAFGVDIDLFSGEPSGFFGQFRDKDRVRAEIKYQF